MLATLSSDVPIIHKVGKPERPAKPDIPYVQTYAGWFVGILLMANHNPYINWVGFFIHAIYNPTNFRVSFDRFFWICDSLRADRKNPTKLFCQVAKW